MKVLIFGSGGYLGGYFQALYPDAITPKADIADAVAVSKALEKEKPDVVINAAGKTGRPNVDWCEDHKKETLDSNVLGPLVLLRECAARNIYWVHLGSGCIYDGDNGGRGYAETDLPNFRGSFYSRTKSWTDQMLQEFPVLNLRLRMPFDGTDSPRNLLMKLKGYSKILDVQNSITYLPDFFPAAKALIEQRATGTFNMVNGGTVSPYQIMELYAKIVDPKHTFERLTLEGLSSVTRAARSNCVLSNEKLLSRGVAMRNIQDALREAFATMKG
jgi:dTDP-4-dehydrorhamnose reductase